MTMCLEFSTIRAAWHGAQLRNLESTAIHEHREKFSSFMKHRLMSHICWDCRQTVGNIMLIVLSFPNLRHDRFERDNFAVAKTLSVFTNSRSSKASWHADASAIGPCTPKTSTNAKTMNSLSCWFEFSSIKIAQGRGGQIPAVCAFYASCGSHQFLHSTALQQ